MIFIYLFFFDKKDHDLLKLDRLIFCIILLKIENWKWNEQVIETTWFLTQYMVIFDKKLHKF